MNIELVDIVLFSTYFFLLFMSIFWLLVLFASDEQEVKKKKFKLKNMNSGKEKLIGEKELIKELGKPVN